MIKILFVCHGNICRSPMAEFIFRDIVERNMMQDEFLISSSATSREEIFNGVGNYIYPPAKQVLLKHNIGKTSYTDIFAKRAKQINTSEYEYYDYIICMDSYNLRNLKMMMGSLNEKVSLLLDWLDSADKSKSIADPWYSGDFTTCYNQIYDGCVSLYEKLVKQINIENK